MKKVMKFLLLTGLIFSVVACESGKKEHSGGDAISADVKVVNELDPVCEMPTSGHLKDTLTYEGKLYGFCSSNCKEEFKKNPDILLKKKQ
jgi:YHS domain-containing protein